MIAAVATAAFALWRDERAAFGAAYGGVAAVAISALLGMKIARWNDKITSGEAPHMASLALGFAPRFAAVLVAFWCGIGLLALPPAPMITAFAATYLAYLAGFAGRGRAR